MQKIYGGLVSSPVNKMDTYRGSAVTRTTSGAVVDGDIPIGEEYEINRTPKNMIKYTAAEKLIENDAEMNSYPDGNTGLRTKGFDAAIISHTFLDGEGIITFDKTVTAINDYAFYGVNITSLTIPNTVTVILSYGLYLCTSIAKPIYNNKIFMYMPKSYSGLFNIPKGIVEIRAHAFSGCTGLTSITIPNTVTSIGIAAFSGCSGLTSITIPNSVTSIEGGVFQNCSCLTSIIIPNNVTSIGTAAFQDCGNLTSITIPDSVTSIGDGAFYDCYLFYGSFVNNSTLTNDRNWGATFIDAEREDGLLIKDNAVVKCRQWATSVTIPSSVTSIEDRGFYGCTNLTSVTIPNSVTSIVGSGFTRCSGLTSITIPNSVTIIGNLIFSNCSGLTSITIPENVTSVGGAVCSNCTNLEAVTVLPTTPPSITNSYYGALFKDTSENLVIYVPAESVDAYKAASGWSTYADKIHAIPEE